MDRTSAPALASARRARFLAAALLILAGCADRQPVPAGPNVLLLVVDTLRADHLGSYDPTVELTPNLDRFAARSVVFRDTVAQASNTINSAPCILASAFVREHGYTNYKLAVARKHGTLAEALDEAGYETYAVSTNPHVTTRNGLAQGFEVFLDGPTWTDTDAHEVNRLFLDWLSDRGDTQRPFFAMLWYIDPHVPYDPPSEKVEAHVPPELRPLVSMKTKRPGFQDLSEDEKAVTRGLYRGEVSYFDDQFGDLLAELERRGTLDDTLVVFTSDHGESFWEHDGVDGRPVVGHGVSLFREEVAVPLIVKLPRERYSGIVESRVSSIDIAPTVLDAVGLAREGSPRRFRGSSLLPLISEEGEEVTDRAAFSELLTDFRGQVNIRLESAETDAGKLVLTHVYRGKTYNPPVQQLFDPEGRQIVLDAGDPLARELREELTARLHEWEASLRPIRPERARLGRRGDDLEKRLKALGYVN